MDRIVEFIPTAIVLMILGIVVGLVIYKLYKDRKSGKCCSGCSGCPMSGSCHSARNTKE